MASSNIVTISEANFETEVAKSSAPVLLDFWAEWCGPCKMLAPVLEELAADYNGKVKIGKVNVDDNQQLAVKYGVASIPTLLLFNGGQVIKQIVGLKAKKAYKQEIDLAIG